MDVLAKINYFSEDLCSYNWKSIEKELLSHKAIYLITRYQNLRLV